MDDESPLVARVQRGDTAAFDELVRRYMQRAFAVAYRVLGHREDAEDLVQEAFMVTLERIDTFDTTRPFAPWFLRIVANRALSARRARARRQTEPLPADPPAPGRSPHHDAEGAEVRERFARAVAELPDRQRTVVRLFELDGFSSVEIAAMLALSEGTVRWYLHKARGTLREALAPLTDRDE